MENIVNIIVAMFQWLIDTQLFGIGLLWWVVTPTLLGLALSLFAKKGEKDE